MLIVINKKFPCELRFKSSMSMNRVFPSINELEQLNPKLTPGEWFLVGMLNQKLDKEWKIYVQPYLPNLRPDIVIVHPQKGLVVWEVKDWNLDIFSFYDGRLYGQANGNSWVQENPIYKTKLYIDTITEYILTPNYESANIGQLLSFTKCRGAVYFHTSNTAKTFKLFKESLEPHKNVISIFTREMIENNFDTNFQNRFSRFYEPSNPLSMDAVHQFLQPPDHEKERLQGLPKLTAEQARVSVPERKDHPVCKRIRGVAGSGKSMVLAYRASMQNNKGGNILILSYNSTMSHALRDLLKRSHLKLDWSRIEITHFHMWLYHQSIFSGLMSKNSGLDEGNSNNFDAMIQGLEDIISNSQKSPYYSESRLVNHYDGIYIDEAQDFETKWINLLASYLTQNGELVIFADHRQNIYQKEGGRNISRMTRCNFNKTWIKLTRSIRVTIKVASFLNTLAEQTGIGDKDDSQLEKILTETQRDLEFNVHACIKVHTTREAIACIDQAISLFGNTHPSDIAILTLDHQTGLAAVKKYESKFSKISHVFGESKLEQKYRKYAFRMGSGCLKMCTIHSFKGWEINNVVVIWTQSRNQDQHSSRHELLYTAISRTLGNIVVINSIREDDILFTHWDQIEPSST